MDLLAALADLIAIAGGGGSGGGGGGGGGGSFSGGSSSGGDGGPVSVMQLFLTIVVTLLVVITLIASSIKAGKLVRARREKMKHDLAAAADKDKVWEPGALTTLAKETFLRFQKDWSAFDLDSMKTYMTDRYYQHNLLMMGALKLANRHNDVRNPVVGSVEIVGMNDAENNEADTFKAQLTVSVQDVLRDTGLNTQLFSTYLNTTEFYKFDREGDRWLFDGIDQLSANASLYNADVAKLARDNGYFYSLDWGYLLLPRRGLLFSGGAFGRSDINNHVIGLYHETIIQLYTYMPVSGNVAQRYVVAQTSVPKQYGNIIVRRKKGLWSRLGASAKGLHRIQTEWSDFNKRYEVLATDRERATSFELLNPKYMEKLEAVPFDVTIEVVDNVVYLHTSEAGAKPGNYPVMLELLRAAFKEMRL